MDDLSRLGIYRIWIIVQNERMTAWQRAPYDHICSNINSSIDIIRRYQKTIE